MTNGCEAGGHVMYKRFVKRGIDVVLSLLGIVVLVVPMLVIAVIVKLDSPGPVLFRQKRVGKDQTYFYILKFRSMPVSISGDVPTHQFQQQHLLSRWQRWIRRTSLDELPQLFNILKGEMSVVGPRPALWNQTELIALREAHGVNALRPGLTGWAQINGRDRLTECEKARMDAEYANQVSLMFDCCCFLHTLSRVLQCDGVAEDTVMSRGGYVSLVGGGARK